MSSALSDRLSTGIDGLDEILHGGFIPERSYMLRGPAGSGKTILGLHVLERGLREGETGLFINLEEDLDDLEANAAALGFDTDAIEFLDLSPTADVFGEDIGRGTQVEKLDCVGVEAERSRVRFQVIQVFF